MPRTRLITLLSAVWFLTVLLPFHLGPEGYPAGGPLWILADLLLLCLIAASAWGLGAFLLSPLRLSDDSPGEAPVFELGAGLGALALLVFIVAGLGILYRPVVVALLAAGVLLLRRLSDRRLAGGPAAPEPWTRGEAGLAAACCLSGVMTLICSLAPPEFYDALIYHLAIPDLYIRHHGMIPVPHHFYAGYPANMGMLYAIGLLLRGGTLAVSMHWLCGALAVVALAAAGRRHLDRPTGLVAALLFALTPGVMLVSTWAIADLAVTLFGLLCFAAVLNLWRGGDRRWLIAAGLFAGLALGTKYTALLVVCAPGAAAIALRPGVAWRARAIDVARFAVLAMLVMSPWLARNMIFSGNPFDPYLGVRAARGTESTDIGDEIHRRLPQDTRAVSLAAHYLSAPWNATMKRVGAGGYLGAAFLLLIPPLVFLRRLPSAIVPLAIMAGVGFAAWTVTSQVTRYLFPVVPLLAMLAAAAARRLPRILVAPALAWVLFYNLSLFVLFAETSGDYRVLSGAESGDEYLSRRVSYYPAARFVGASAPPGARVLMVGEGRGFYMPGEYLAATPFDPLALDVFVEHPGDERALLSRLNSEGFTHLLVSGPELTRTRHIGADELMRRYFPSGGPRLLFERHDVRVYSLPE